ncbi:MAG: hypothetical protein ACP5UN_00015 [Candidatus Micrarchaeia archaeon]
MLNFIDLRLILLVIISFIYMLFDVLNKRNVPTIFAYSTIVIGVIMTILYFNISIILLSSIIAIIIIALGWLAYRVGQIGGADIIELAVISLILPIQNTPLLFNINQYGFPFILSVFIATGIIAIIFVPLYYLPKAYKMKHKLIATKNSIFKSMLVAISYLIFLALLIFIYNLNIFLIVLFLIIITCATVLIAFEKSLSESMITFIDVRNLEEGDMVAHILMNKEQERRLKKFGFTNLITKKFIDKVKSKNIKEKIPVYRNAIPLALPIFFGLIISILIGNILFFIF